MSKPKVLICPYCGDTQTAGEQCRACGGLFEPLSRQATHNAMGPWFIRDDRRPFQPGCSYETLIKLLERGQVNRFSILRSPTTKQFWTVAKRVPGVAHLLGYCHNCDAPVDSDDHGCHSCGVPFGAYLDRNFLGLPEVRPLPWEAGGDEAQPRAEVSSRAMEFRRSVEPIGISSFASDDELRGRGLHAGAGYSPATLGSAPAISAGAAPMYGGGNPLSMSNVESSISPALTSQTAMGAAAGMGGAEAGVATRALQRKLDQQNRTIKTLALAMALAGAIIVCLLALFAARSMSASNPPSPATETPPSNINPANDATAEHAAATLPVESPTSAPSVDAAHDQAQQNDEQYANARRLMAEAAQLDRPAADRIRDYEQALQLLKNIQKTGGLSPGTIESKETLTDVLQQLERELENLKLREYFP